jgi:DNA-binding XRE family transcriptional regulator
MASLKGNQKIAKNRGYNWHKKLIEGRIDAELHPTKLKLSRIRRLVSQETVAQKLGISLATYGAIERARRPTSQKTATSICAVLKFPLNEIFRLKDSKYIAIR